MNDAAGLLVGQEGFQIVRRRGGSPGGLRPHGLSMRGDRQPRPTAAAGSTSKPRATASSTTWSATSSARWWKWASAAGSPEKIPEILEARDRRAAGPIAPPNGLCLMWIKY